MLKDIIPKLPMRDLDVTKKFYLDRLSFTGSGDYGDYFMVKKEDIEIHFFEFKELKPKENYGQVYIRTTDIERIYQSLLEKKVDIHPNGPLESKPWGQREFSILDPDHNLLTFGQTL